MTKFRKTFWPTILGLALCIPAAWAQQKDPRISVPIAPYPPLSPGEKSSKAPEESSSTTVAERQRAELEQRPLSSVEEITLDSPDRGRSYLLPSFHFAQIGDTNARSTSGASELHTASTVSGGIALRRVRGRSEWMANYAGGTTLYNTHSDLNTSFHQLGIKQTITGRRWSLLLSDYFSYLPESSSATGAFGGGAGFGPGLGRGFEGSPSGLSPIFTPSQTILTGRTRRVSNSFVGEVQYKASPRSSITVSGAYRMLRFLDSGFINGHSEIFRTGYNYAVTAQDSVAVMYGFTRFRFDGISQGMNNHVLQVAYGRRVTGRLAFQLAAGPLINTFRHPLAGSETVLSWNMESFLRYRFQNTDLGISYLRYMTGGSGVLVGAQTDEARMTVGRRLSRMWSGFLSLGYVHNASLTETTARLLDRTFNLWTAGVHLSRPWGRYTSLDFSYGVYREGSSASFCTGSTCGTHLLRHYFRFGFSWQLRPIQID